MRKHGTLLPFWLWAMSSTMAFGSAQTTLGLAELLHKGGDCRMIAGAFLSELDNKHVLLSMEPRQRHNLVAELCFQPTGGNSSIDPMVATIPAEDGWNASLPSTSISNGSVPAETDADEHSKSNTTIFQLHALELVRRRLATSVDTFGEFSSAVADGARINVSADITFTSTITISSGTSVAVTSTKDATLSGGDSTQLFINYGELNISTITLADGYVRMPVSLKSGWMSQCLC